MSIDPLICAALQSKSSLLISMDIEGITGSHTALIDSGSSANFIDPQYARRLSLPLTELSSPRQVLGINGKEVRDAVRFKCTLKITVQSHSFTTTFFCLPLGDKDIILGLPWLKQANPDIDWPSMILKLPDPLIAKAAQVIASSAPPFNIPPEHEQFRDVFGEQFFAALPPHRPYDCAIPLEEGKEVPWGPIYPMTPAETAALKEHIDSELKSGKIRPSNSPAGAPVMFVKKSDGRLRLVVDYRRLNNITIKDRYALPRQDELIEKLRHAKIFTKLDLRSGYNNVRIKEGDEWKTAFRTKYGLFESLVMPFGLTNAPAVFQRFMNDIFRDILDIYVIVYLDDILIFSNNSEEHVDHVREVLTRLQKHNLFCNPEKCHFAVTTVTYIGLVITPDGISMEKEKVKAIMEWPAPLTVKQVQSFLGFANFYRRFIENFSRIARPLHILTHLNQPWVWGYEQQAAFVAIKEAISKEPVLAHPNENEPHQLETDASGTAMGAVLSQRQPDGRLHPVAFMSMSFSPAELNYDTHDKELLAIVRSFEHWRIFLEGTEQPVLVLCDHKNLEGWKQSRNFNRRHARWHLMLASYNFVIKHRSGKQSEKPDALSRRADHVPSEPEPQVMLPEHLFLGNSAEMSAPLMTRIKDALQDDPSLQLTLEAATSMDKLPQSVASKFKDYSMNEGLLLFQGRIVIPDEPEIKQELLAHFHDSPAAGHQGRAKTLELIARHYYWPAMKFQVNRYVDSCEVCQRSKGHEKHYALKPLPTPAGPWEDVSYDFIVKLPKSRGFDSILTVVDRFSKMMHLIPCKESSSAEDVAQMFLQHIWRLHGTPKRTVSDRGPSFNAKFMRALYKALQIEPRFSTAYHPQTDGQTEIKNKWVENYLRAFVNHKQTDWADWLPMAEFAHNNAKNDATGKSPFEIIYGRSPSISPSLEPTGNPIADDRARELHETIQEVSATLNWTQERYKHADGGKTPPEFVVGDKVWLLSLNITSQRPNKKLDHKRYGPFTVAERISSHAYRLELPDTMKIHDVFPVTLLSPVVKDTDFNRSFVPPPPVITSEGEEHFEVDKFLDWKIKDGKWHYRVRWKGYGPLDDTWEDVEDLKHLNE
ncbi:Retrotransposable element Tf2 protein [Ceratobasidium sp. AG-Ba]|nr:Retrotransposable element Tf2 protein [Ceratobasidium sp. AG-Ba]